jgi:hypothetical protein
MRITIKSALLCAAATGAAALAAYPSAATTPPSLVYQLKGTAVAETRDIDTDGDGSLDTTADCFDVEVYDPRTGHLSHSGGK